MDFLALLADRAAAAGVVAAAPQRPTVEPVLEHLAVLGIPGFSRAGGRKNFAHSKDATEKLTLSVVDKTIYVAIEDMNDSMTVFSSASGLIIGIVGGVLAFASGATLLVGGTQDTMMNSASVSIQNEALALWLFALGGIVIVTAVVSIISVGRGHRKLLSGAMIAYGIVMLLVGGSMAGGLVAMMSTPIYGYAMIISGILMVVNGSTMSRRQTMM